MSQIKHARRPAIVIAALALIAALAGTALAGSEPIANPAGKVDKALKDAKKAKKKAKKAIKLAKAADKEQGEKGDPGTNGTNGTNGDDAASMLTARITGLSGGTFALEYGFVMESGPPGTLASRTTLSPNRDIVARDLRIKVTDNPGITFDHLRKFEILDDGVEAGVRCSVINIETVCGSGGSSATIAAGSEIAIKATTGTNTVDVADALIGWRAYDAVS